MLAAGAADGVLRRLRGSADTDADPHRALMIATWYFHDR
jgi:hypothetical protein